MKARNPEVERTEEQLEGDAAHWAVAAILRHLVAVSAGATPPALPTVGMTAPNGVVVTDEMMEAVEMFVDDVREQIGDDMRALHIEELVTAPETISIHSWGRPDVWWFVGGPAGGYLYVPDYKHGRRFVDAFENWQLIGYVAAILERPEFAVIPRAKIQVIMSIVQPRNFHQLGPVRRWTETADKLAPWWVRMREAAAKATGPNPMAKVGDNCGDCVARFECEALAKAADWAMDFTGTATPVEMPPEAWGVHLRMLEKAQKILDARVTGAQGVVEGLIRQQKNVPGYELTRTTAREVWTKDAKEVFTLGDIAGHDLRKPPAPITPAQARKLGIPPELVAGYSTRPAGALKLGPVSTTLARKVFNR